MTQASLGDLAPATSNARTAFERRLQGFPVLYREGAVPQPGWDVVVDGLVSTPVRCPAASIGSMIYESRTWDLHCVQGWSRLECLWEGMPASRLIDAANPLPSARYVVAASVGGGYSSCLGLHRARRSLLAWRLDGADLAPEHGGPLRLVAPPTKWGYKGVKWVARLTLTDEFTPGFWEEQVGDPQGDIPENVLHHVEDIVRRRLY